MDEKVIEYIKAVLLGGQKAVKQIQQLAQLGDLVALTTLEIFQKANQKDPQALLLIQQVLQAMVLSARQGAKLNYIKSLKNICNEDEELVYMKTGGKVCPVCQKKKVTKAKCGSTAAAFKAKYQQEGGTAQKKKTSQKTTKDIPYNQKNHDRLIKEFKNAKKDKNGNPIGWSEAKKDSLHLYNMKDPRVQGV